MIASHVRVIVRKVIAPAVSNDMVALRKLLYLRRPNPVIIQTSMHKDNWNAFAKLKIVQLNAVDSYFLKPVFCLSGFAILRCCLRGNSCAEQNKESKP